MPEWVIKTTETFQRYLKEHKKNRQLLNEMDKKILRLKEDPEIVGGELSGRLHGKRSTRLAKKYRLIFSIDKENGIVYLEALDHREDIYNEI
jgi:addiction module RelE/StbE family toxin